MRTPTTRAGAHRESHRAAGGGNRIAALTREVERQKQEIDQKAASLADARASLAASIERTSDLFENAPIAFFSLDGQGVVTEVNSRAVHFFGCDRDRLVARPLIGLVEHADRPKFLDHMRRCRREGGARTELRLAGGLGGGPMEIESQGAKGKAGIYLTALSTLHRRRRAGRESEDAEREQLLAERREAAATAASRAKDLFIAELSHELRTPLTPILAAVSALGKRDDLPEFLKATIDMIRRNVEHEARLIDDLLDLSRIERRQIHLDLGICDAHEIINEAAAHLLGEADSRGIGVVLALYARESRLRADPLRLRQIVLNLVVNAIRNTPAGGEVSISTSNMAGDLRISVRDNGVGIEPERLKQIFEPFSEQRPRSPSSGGLGLGLAIVKGLVDAHDGRVVALSGGKGRGATFVVDLPTAKEPAGTPADPTIAETRAPEVPPPHARRRILLVEDHADTSAALQVFLELQGFHVELATTGEAAIELARNRPDLIICDIGLPGVSGFEVMRQIQAERPVQAIALSGYGSEGDVTRAKEAGFAMHLTKPVTVEVLLEAIHQLSRSARPRTDFVVVPPSRPS